MDGSFSEGSDDAPSEMSFASPGGGDLVGVRLKLTAVGDEGIIKVR